MTTLAFVLAIVVYFGYRAIKKRKGKEEKPEVREFEDDFKDIYGTTWDAWLTVNKDVLGDNDMMISRITKVFGDMYRTVQEMNRGAKA